MDKLLGDVRDPLPGVHEADAPWNSATQDVADSMLYRYAQIVVFLMDVKQCVACHLALASCCVSQTSTASHVMLCTVNLLALA
jgi:hypothetical protein